MVLDFFTESVRQASEAAHAHSHCEIGAFDIARADMGRVGAACYRFLLTSDACRWAVAFVSLSGSYSVDLNELGNSLPRLETLSPRLSSKFLSPSEVNLNAIRKTAG